MVNGVQGQSTIMFRMEASLALTRFLSKVSNLLSGKPMNPPSPPLSSPAGNCTGMRGDFLGQASLAWGDLEIGRDLNLTLIQREGARDRPVEGTIRLLVGEPLPEVIEQEQRITEDATTTTAAMEQLSSVVTAEKQVCMLDGYMLWLDTHLTTILRLNAITSRFRSMQSSILNRLGYICCFVRRTVFVN